MSAFAAPPSNQGERLYRQGQLPAGSLLTGTREEQGTVTGADAACAKCHRRSGLGSVEGQIIIPPIASRYLFSMRGRDTQDPDLRSHSGLDPNRKPYDAITLARAIRDGVGASGRKLSYLMPRYRLDDADMAELIRYLQSLGSDSLPGVTDGVLHFATIITPDADSRKSDGMLSVLNQFFSDKNEFIRGGIRPMQTAGGVHYRISRRWQLHVWRLSGAPQSWQAQLNARLSAEPVLAVISGIGGATWRPVHDFCEENSLPCLFPNTDVPVTTESNFYSLYFDKGMELEASLVGRELSLLSGAQHSHRRVVQLFRFGDIGEEAATALQIKLKSEAIEVRNIAIDDRSMPLATAMQKIRADDDLVLWLRPPDLDVAALSPPPAKSIYVSGLMANLEQAPIPAAWRPKVKVIYPVDLPELRKFRMNYPLAWLKVRHIALIDERIQANTYLACGILAEQLTSMLDNFGREFLIERTEDMLSRRILTGYFPRLSLAPDQRFASKGGYLVHFVGPTGTAIAPDSDWIVP